MELFGRGRLTTGYFLLQSTDFMLESSCFLGWGSIIINIPVGRSGGIKIHTTVTTKAVSCCAHMIAVNFLGQWLWLSWLSGCFQFQRSVVQIQSSANVYLNWTFVCCQLCIEKTKIKKKRPGMAHLKKLDLISQFYGELHLNWLLTPNK